MRTLILIDRLNWAYHSIARALVKYGDPRLEVMHIKGNSENIKKAYKRYDQFLVMGWQTFDSVNFLPKDKTLIGVHGHHAWDGRQTMPHMDVEPPKDLHRFLKKFKGVNVVSKRLQRLFPYAVYTPNGVDTDVFVRESNPGPAPTGSVQDDFRGAIGVHQGMSKQITTATVGCAYNPKHDWRKGVKEFIEPAAKKAGCELRLAPRTKDLSEMPAYYNSIDIYVCASSSEGMSLSVLEAMACGRIIISTWPLEQSCYMKCDRTPDDVRRMVAQVASFDGDFWKVNSEKTRACAEKWSWEKVVPIWMEWVSGDN